MSGFSYTVRIEDADMHAELACLVDRMENRPAPRGFRNAYPINRSAA
jgi:hypothetical protein